ncbi:hypothetical protein [Tautonia plasticadhaerens]|uniref:Uncharacterized protein n=1 Tax=Tautonia plasticadhaerens TaxID=2527974 RepID=A0A518GUG7_9BACT|nr:hypothetical protein [Tautonia plasticadhaerens]QDV32235.1 hypothetical protein ElP_00580 [Tautonia plasticadhaerens]
MNTYFRTGIGLLAGPASLLTLAAAAAAQVVPEPPAPPASAEPIAPAPVVAPSPPAVVERQVVVEDETPADQRRQDEQFAGQMRDEPQQPPRNDRPIRIAIDTDGDGTFDSVQAVYASALSRAIRQSTERMQETRGLSILRLSGTVRDLQEVTLARFDQPHQVARVANPEGRTAKVDLGPAEQLAPLELAKGDAIEVIGHRGMINDRPVLMAVEISKEGQSAKIARPDDGYMKRVRGEIRETRTATFRGRDEPQVIAEVSMAGGRQSSVILGPESKLQGVDLGQGTSAAMLVRPARLNGEEAMVAEQIRIGDRTITLRDTVGRRPEVETQSSSTSQDSGSPADEKPAALRLDDSKP